MVLGPPLAYCGICVISTFPYTYKHKQIYAVKMRKNLSFRGDFSFCGIQPLPAFSLVTWFQSACWLCYFGLKQAPTWWLWNWVWGALQFVVDRKQEQGMSREQVEPARPYILKYFSPLRAVPSLGPHADDMNLQKQFLLKTIMPVYQSCVISSYYFFLV